MEVCSGALIQQLPPPPRKGRLGLVIQPALLAQGCVHLERLSFPNYIKAEWDRLAHHLKNRLAVALAHHLKKHVSNHFSPLSQEHPG